MKFDYDPVTGKSPDDDKPDPYEGFDVLAVGGTACMTCGALIPGQGTQWPKLHLEWHARTKTL